MIVGQAILSAEGFGTIGRWLAGRIAGRVVLSQATRLRLFYDTLQLMKPAKSAEEALSLLSGTLNGVEDAYSGVTAVAEPGLAYAGRMYPPMADNITRLANGGLEAVTKGQRLLFGPDGSIRIFAKKTGELIFSKAGL